jgi:hypothetical protein
MQGRQIGLTPFLDHSDAQQKAPTFSGGFRKLQMAAPPSTLPRQRLNEALTIHWVNKQMPL